MTEDKDTENKGLYIRLDGDSMSGPVGKNR